LGKLEERERDESITMALELSNRGKEKKIKEKKRATSPFKYSGISDLSKRPSGKKILLSGPA
jgi:hypothetical protein